MDKIKDFITTCRSNPIEDPILEFYLALFFLSSFIFPMIFTKLVYLYQVLLFNLYEALQ